MPFLTVNLPAPGEGLPARFAKRSAGARAARAKTGPDSGRTAVTPDGRRPGKAPGEKPERRDARRALPALILILALFLALAAGYARATPVGASPDEGAHLQYVRILATEARLPALDLTRRRDRDRDVNYEAHQPPLYYALAVPFFHAGRALGGDDGAGQACRLLSILIAAAGTLLVWLIAREAAPDRPALWLAAAAVAAFLPMRLAVAASVSNDSLAEATGSLTLLLLLRALSGPATWRQGASVGAALGLAVLAKASAILLLPAVLLTLSFLLQRKLRARGPGADPAAGGDRAAGAGLPCPGAWIGTAAGVAAVVGGWWFVRNHLLYGDPLAQKAFNWYFADTFRWESFRDGGFTFGSYLSEKVFPTACASFWGAFGHLDPTRPDLFMGAYGPGEPGPGWGYPPRSWLYPWLNAAAGLALAGGALYLAWVLPARGAAAPAERGELPCGARAGILALHALFVFAAFLNFNATYFQAQGRYLFPAIAAIALGLAGGWLEWLRSGVILVRRARGESEPLNTRSPGRLEIGAAAVIAAAMSALAVYALVGVIMPGFQRG